MAVIEKDFKLCVQDIGASNLLTNKGILSLLENIACYHSDLAGYGINQMSTTHLSWVLLHWKVKIFKRTTYNSNVHLKTWSRNANKCVTYRDFEMYDDNGNLLCIATSKWTLVSTQDGSIVRITPDVIDNYNSEDDKCVFEQVDITKLREPEGLSNNPSPSYTFTVQRRDIDMNHHLHNTYYLDYAIEALPQEVYENLNCNEFEIMYKNGAKLGDKVNCYYAKQDNSHFVVMKSAEDSRLHAIIKFINI